MINPDMTGLAALGRGEDNYLAHVAKGEMIVPPLGISKDTRNRLNAEMKAVGLDPNEYTVGSGMSVNPITNLPEFGFFKKIGKSITKILDPVAKVASVIPGPHQPFARAYTAIDSSLEQKKLADRAAAQAATPVLPPTFPNIQTGAVMPIIAPDVQLPSIFGEDKTPEFIKKIVDIFGPARTLRGINPASSGLASLYGLGGTSGLDNIFGADGILRGINPITAGLASLYGLATKKAAEKERFGVKDIRDTIRPDLARSSNMGLAGFDVGFANGGEVLDMRNGGESIGPGTGTSDDIPAMLSDGEFVMTAAANRGIGGFKVTKKEDSIELLPNSNPNRKKGADNMMDLMKTFEKYDKAFT
tara:strand:+ start:775 stop:1851 length:1077 start_codon:yes stop_codon:yes gene_type:complete